MSGPSEVEIRAKKFMADVADAADVLHDGTPLTIRVIAREGLLLSVELTDEVVEAANEYRAVLDRVSSEYSAVVDQVTEPPYRLPEGGGLERLVAAEAKLPELKETYERKHALALELGELTDRAVEIVENRQPVEPKPIINQETPWDRGVPNRGFLARAFRLLGKRG
jgi:hypothetical protein